MKIVQTTSSPKILNQIQQEGWEMVEVVLDYPNNLVIRFFNPEYWDTLDLEIPFENKKEVVAVLNRLDIHKPKDASIISWRPTPAGKLVIWKQLN